MKTNLLSVAMLSLAALAACGRSSATDVSRPRTPSLAFSTESESAVDLSGTWAFVLAASDVATSIRQQCVESSGDDVTKANACWNEFANEAAREKIRFTTDGAGQTVWTSFGTEGSEEVIFLQVPVELGADGPGRVVGKIAGVATGKQAEQFEKSSLGVMHLDLVNARTIVMNDPTKGRLVFAKE